MPYIYGYNEMLPPIGRYNLGRLFQSVESRTNNAAVGGSSPSSTTFCGFDPLILHQTRHMPALIALKLY